MMTGSATRFRRVLPLALLGAMLAGLLMPAAGLQRSALAEEAAPTEAATEAAPIETEPVAVVEPEADPIVPEEVPSEEEPVAVVAPEADPISSEAAPIETEPVAVVEPEADPSAPEATPTEVAPLPVVTLVASGACTADGGYDGLAQIDVQGGEVTVTDLRLIRAAGAPPEELTSPVALPVGLALGQTSWSWHLAAEATSGLEPVALLIRVADVPGEDEAIAAAGDGQSGWLWAALPALPAPCLPPAPPATDPVVVALADDAAVKPGRTTNVRYRVTNPAATDVTVQLSVTNSLPGWEAEIFAADGVTPVEVTTIPPGQHLDLVISVEAPADAYLGDQNRTTLVATPG